MTQKGGRKTQERQRALQPKVHGVNYLAPNVCRAPGDKVYFIADPPHLLKTIRNAWYNS